MTPREEILRAFQGEDTASMPYLADLTLWYHWHASRSTLPPDWQVESLTQVSQRMGSPVWAPLQVWTVELSGIGVETVETSDERTITYETAQRRLMARWVRGPDGDWWQSEYPIKDEDDLDAGLTIAESTTYTLETSTLARMQADVSCSDMTSTAFWANASVPYVA